jgi:glycosyltransferase involved in cell wall biosynthesis
MQRGNLAAATKLALAAVAMPTQETGRPLVCHVASGDLWAGAESQLASLLQGLARESEFRLCAILFNEGRLADEARQCGVDVMVIPESTTGFWEAVRRASGYLGKKETRIIHSHGYKSNLLAKLVARRCHIPVVVRTQHGMPEPFQGIRGLKQGVLQLADRAIARWGTDGVIAVSEEMRVRLASSVGSGKVTTVPNGIDASAVISPWSSEESKERLGLPRDCPTVGAAGRLEPIKRLDLFLRMAAQISEREPRCRFVIAGTGSQESNLRALASSLGLAKKVLFLGHRSDVWDVMRALDIFVFSSDHEGLPMVLLEALALGVPVVARAVGGIAEVIEDGKSGILVPSAEPSGLAQACLVLLADQRHREELASTGAERVASVYSVERTAASVARFYAGLLQRMKN